MAGSLRSPARSVTMSLLLLLGSAACSTSPTNGATASSPGAPGTSSSTSASTPPATTTGATPHATESNPPGDIPDNQAYVPYSPSGAHVSVKVPEGWARTTSADGSVTFTDKLNSITVVATNSTTTPSAASLSSQVVPGLRASVPKFADPKIANVTRAGGTVLLLTYQGDSAPNAVTGKVVRDAFERYVYVHAGHRLDVTVSGPTTADNVDPWKIVSNSVRWS